MAIFINFFATTPNKFKIQVFFLYCHQQNKKCLLDILHHYILLPKPKHRHKELRFFMNIRKFKTKNALLSQSDCVQ